MRSPRRVRAFRLGFMLVLGFSQAAWAQSDVLTLSQAQAIARRTHPQLRVLKQEEAAALAGGELSRIPAPRQGEWRVGLGLQSDAPSGRVSYGLERETVSEQSREVLREQALLAAREVQLRRVLLLREKDAEVREKYLSVLSAQAEQAVAQLLLAETGKLETVFRARADQGAIPGLQLKQVQAEQSAQAALSALAAQALATAWSDFYAVLNQNEPDQKPALESLALAGSQKAPTLAEIRRRLKKNHPALALLALEREKAALQIRAIRARQQAMPVVSWELEASQKQDESLEAGLVFGVKRPLGVRAQAAPELAVAEKLLGSAREKEAAELAVLSRAAQQAWRVYEKSLPPLPVYQKQLIPALEENLRLSREASALGQGDAADLLVQVRQLAEALRAQEQARSQTRLAWHAWLSALFESGWTE